jgi:hypothetical protein
MFRPILANSKHPEGYKFLHREGYQPVLANSIKFYRVYSLVKGLIKSDVSEIHSVSIMSVVIWLSMPYSLFIYSWMA